jgi:hypothetical protein
MAQEFEGEFDIMGCDRNSIMPTSFLLETYLPCAVIWRMFPCFSKSAHEISIGVVIE